MINFKPHFLSLETFVVLFSALLSPVSSQSKRKTEKQEMRTAIRNERCVELCFES